ncbi:hypothetical protein [Methanochimaera problematica]|uniref:hypothetical protein n=1 Tax=Methanochimaera problematica TaxID=2609417 RepID=UPI00293908D1|nr:hypothetical protein [Methanoplanus sp. FWC-SCC4]
MTRLEGSDEYFSESGDPDCERSRPLCMVFGEMDYNCTYFEYSGCYVADFCMSVYKRDV